MLTITDTVTLWMVDGTPRRMVWRGTRWRVTDRPTPLLGEPEWLSPLISHPPHGTIVGWRFQGTSNDSTISHVFDILRDEDGHWVVARIYD